MGSCTVLGTVVAAHHRPPRMALPPTAANQGYERRTRWRTTQLRTNGSAAAIVEMGQERTDAAQHAVHREKERHPNCRHLRQRSRQHGMRRRPRRESLGPRHCRECFWRGSCRLYLLCLRAAPGTNGRAMQKPRLADVIAFALTDDIVSQRLAPGAALDEETLGRRFGASRTPVREALRELAAGGLVELRPHRAPVVARVDETRVADMFEVMADLEALCARHASSAMSPEQRRRLEAHHREMGEAVRQGDVNGYRAANVVLHTLIYEGAGNAYLREITQATRVRLGPYRGAQLEAPQRLNQSYAEHDAIVSSIMRGDGKNAADLMRRHLSVTRVTLRLLVSANSPKT